MVTKASALAPNDVFLTLDGGRRGNATTMKQAFTYLPPGRNGQEELPTTKPKLEFSEAKVKALPEVPQFVDSSSSKQPT